MKKTRWKLVFFFFSFFSQFCICYSDAGMDSMCYEDLPKINTYSSSCDHQELVAYDVLVFAIIYGIWPQPGNVLRVTFCYIHICCTLLYSTFSYFLEFYQRSQSGLWIRRIRIQIQESKNDPQIQKKVKNFSCFEVLDVLFWGLKASPLACAFFTKAKG